MIQRPFKLAHRPLTSSSVLELVVSFEGPVPEQDNPLAPLEHFQNVAARGGLGGEGILPTQSTLRLTSHEALSGNTRRWRYEAVCLHPSSLFVLENVLHDIHLEGPRIREATISSGLVTSHREGCEQVLPFAYEPLPFEYTFEAQGGEVLVEVDFAKEQAASRSWPSRRPGGPGWDWCSAGASRMTSFLQGGCRPIWRGRRPSIRMACSSPWKT